MENNKYLHYPLDTIFRLHQYSLHLLCFLLFFTNYVDKTEYRVRQTLAPRLPLLKTVVVAVLL